MPKKTPKEKEVNTAGTSIAVFIGFPLIGLLALFMYFPHLFISGNSMKQIESWSVAHPQEYAEIMSGADITLSSLAESTDAYISADKYGDYLVRYVPSKSGDLTLCLESPDPAIQSVYYDGDKQVQTNSCLLSGS